MKFIEFAKYLQKLENTTKRLEMTDILTNLIIELDKEDIDKAIYLSLGYLRTPFETEKFNIADKMMLRILIDTFNVNEEEIGNRYQKTGDLGTIAFDLTKKDTSNIEISVMHEKLTEIAKTEGTGSQEIKVQKTKELLNSIDKISAKYVVRMILGTTRLGFTELTVLDALSKYIGDKNLKTKIEHRYNMHPDIGLIAKVIKIKGEKGLDDINIEPGVPILLQRAQRVKSFDEVMQRMNTTWLEYKLDGTRVQLHMDKNKKVTTQENTLFGQIEEKYLVKTFTRNLEETSNMYPDITEAAIKQIKADSIIMDGEAIGYNPETGEYLSFQEMMQRKRKHGIKEMAKEIPLKYFVFDILYLNGKNLMDKTLEERKEILKNIIEKGKVIELIDKVQTDNTEELYEYFEDAKNKGLEGLIAKNPNDKYQAGARSYSWIKLKVADEKLLEDSVDCVILGYYYGKGVRAKFGMGGLLLGIYDEKEDTFKTISKLGTGLTEQELTSIKALCDKEKVDKPTKNTSINKIFNPDVYVYPKIILEVGADEITKSPSHSAGYALRFPRMLKVRLDKRATQATTIEEIEKMYKKKRS